MDYHKHSTIADSLSPIALAEIAQSFGLDMEPEDYMSDEVFITDEYLERNHGMVTSDHHWDQAWRFGIVVDNDCPMQGLFGFYKNPDDPWDGSYYVPCDYDVEIPLVSLDNPPREYAS